MATNIIIHIGTHKTGTTSIQSFFKKNQKRLRNDEINYINFDKFSDKIALSKAKGERNELCERLRKFLESKVEPNFKNFISFEGFSGDVFNCYNNTKEVLETLVCALPKDSYSKAVVALRRQDEFVQSVYSQFKHEARFAEAEAFVAKVREGDYIPGYDWNRMITVTTSLFGEVKPVPYDPSISNKITVLNEIGKLLGITDIEKRYGSIDRLNVAFSKSASLLYERIHHCLRTDRQRLLLRQHLQASKYTAKGAEHEYLNAEEKIRFLRNYRKSNREIGERYWRENYGITNFLDPVEEAGPDTIQCEKELSVEDELIVDLILMLDKEKDCVGNRLNKRLRRGFRRLLRGGRS